MFYWNWTYSNAEKYGVQAFLNTDTFFNTPEFFERQVLPYTLSKMQFVDWLKYKTWVGMDIINLKIHHVYGRMIILINSYLKPSLAMKGKKNIELTSGIQLRISLYRWCNHSISIHIE